MIIKHRYLKQDWYCVGFDYFTIPPRKWEEVIDRISWCKENLGPRGKQWRQQFITPTITNQELLLQNGLNPFLCCFFMFTNLNDAVLFSLVWYDT